MECFLSIGQSRRKTSFDALACRSKDFIRIAILRKAPRRLLFNRTCWSRNIAPWPGGNIGFTARCTRSPGITVTPRLFFNRALQCLDRLFERQPMRAQKVCRRAASIPHDCCQHNGAVNGATPSARRRSSRFQNLAQFWRNARRIARLGTLLDVAKVGSNVTLQLFDGNPRNHHHPTGIGILGQRQQQVLQGNITVPLLRRIVRRSPQRFREVTRGRENLANLIDDRLRHRRLVSAQTTTSPPKAGTGSRRTSRTDAPCWVEKFTVNGPAIQYPSQASHHYRANPQRQGKVSRSATPWHSLWHAHPEFSLQYNLA